MWSYPECPGVGFSDQAWEGDPEDPGSLLSLSYQDLFDSCFTTVNIHLWAIPSEPNVIGLCLCFDGYWHSQWRNVLGAS